MIIALEYMYKRVRFVCTLMILARTSFLARFCLLVAPEAEELPQLPISPVSKQQTEAEEEKPEEVGSHFEKMKSWENPVDAEYFSPGEVARSARNLDAFDDFPT